MYLRGDDKAYGLPKVIFSWTLCFQGVNLLEHTGTWFGKCYSKPWVTLRTSYAYGTFPTTKRQFSIQYKGPIPLPMLTQRLGLHLRPCSSLWAQKSLDVKTSMESHFMSGLWWKLGGESGEGRVIKGKGKSLHLTKWSIKRYCLGPSLVVQWVRICLPV